MLYTIGKIQINSEEYKEKLKYPYNLSFVKELIDLSGCTLHKCKTLINKIIAEEKIEINYVAKEIHAYMMNEYEEDDL
ncbi:MAG: hypothetical protein LBK13_05660 [Spirochaetales bacterium]|jgi:hypothetical protein|nr:hypothetical protein [Spirochaetales bacterium]